MEPECTRPRPHQARESSIQSRYLNRTVRRAYAGDVLRCRHERNRSSPVLLLLCAFAVLCSFYDLLQSVPLMGRKRGVCCGRANHTKGVRSPEVSFGVFYLRRSDPARLRMSCARCRECFDGSTGAHKKQAANGEALWRIWAIHPSFWVIRWRNSSTQRRNAALAAEKAIFYSLRPTIAAHNCTYCSTEGVFCRKRYYRSRPGCDARNLKRDCH